jgi:hypothetical protein
MELIEEIRWDYALFVTAGAWIAFADHPTARSLRRAVIDTLLL